MIEGSERLIVVLGMVHSGTTILTHILQQHPSVTLGLEPGGNEPNWSLENRWTVLGESEPIQDLLKANDRVLLKSIWYSWWSPDFLVSECQSAKFLCINKPFGLIRESWTKATSLADDDLRIGGEDFQQKAYDAITNASVDFGKKVPAFKQVDYTDLLTNPEATILEVSNWLGLPQFDFDLSQVSSDIDIKKVLGREV